MITFKSFRSLKTCPVLIEDIFFTGTYSIIVKVVRIGKSNLLGFSL